MTTLVDTDVLSLFFRGDVRVVAKFREYAQEHGVVSISIVTYYEVLSGLLHRDARKQMERFLAFATNNAVIPLNQAAAEAAASLYALTRKAGTPVDDVDLLIAGTAIANGMRIATHNLAHFQRLPGLVLEDWAEVAKQE